MSCRRPTHILVEQSYAQAVEQVKRGELDTALSKIDVALPHHPEADSEWHWRFTLLKAEILMRKGLYPESVALLKPELPPTLVATDLTVWRRLTLGSDFSYEDDFPSAEKQLTEAQSLAASSHRELLGEVALRQGTLADLRGDSIDAADLYRRALENARSKRDIYLEVSALGSLGMVGTQREHYDESIDWNVQALGAAQSSNDQRSIAKILQNIGWSYLQMGDYDQALDVLEQARQSTHNAGLINDQLVCQINLAAVKRYLHDLESAENAAVEALDLARKQDNKLLVIESLNLLTTIAIQKGDLAAAASYNRGATETSDSIGDRAGAISAILEAARIAALKGQRESAEKRLRRLIEDREASSAIRWEAHARLAKVYEAENEPAEAEHEYASAIQTIQKARNSIEKDELRMAFLSSAIDFYDDYIDFLMQHDRIGDALRVADLTRSQTLVEGLASSNTKSPAASPSKRSPLELARKLHATLLIYWLGQNHSYLWVATPTKLSYFALPPKSQIDPVVKTYRQSILEGRDVLTGNDQAGQQLFRTLVAPAQSLIPQNSRVILFPAESLYGLNFESLIVPGPTPHFWIEDVTLSTASALAMPPPVATSSAAQAKNLLLVGNPEPASADFPRLAQAPAEMQKIAGHFPQAGRDVLEGPQATPASYLSSNPGRFSYLHFVTHGTASHTRPLESAVILSKAGDSYKLYARDIVQHPLSANLVTISACNGAGTRAYAGEGLVGLSWAFLRAGAHNVIGALWEVSDAKSTPQLMDSLYSGLDQGQDPATALRNAKLGLLHSTGESVFKKPFYWAPFQLYTGS